MPLLLIIGNGKIVLVVFFYISVFFLVTDLPGAQSPCMHLYYVVNNCITMSQAPVLQDNNTCKVSRQLCFWNDFLKKCVIKSGHIYWSNH